MTDRHLVRRVLVCATALLALAAAGTGADVGAGADVGLASPDPDRHAGQGSDEEVLVVDADGGADYASVQAAVDAADAGDTVRVRQGTYRETVTVEKNVTLVAPEGAVLDGSTLAADATAIEFGRSAAPVVAGFTVVDYNVGLSARGSAADWEFRDTTVENASFVAVAVAGSDGDWRLRNVTIRQAEVGVWAQDATGDWRIEDALIRNVTRGRGINALSTTGDWTVANVTVRGAEYVAVEASFASGDWRIENSTLRDATVGIGALGTSGDWTVWRSTVANASTNEAVRFGKPALKEGAGVDASDSNGSWTVRGSRFADNEAGDVVAPGADPAGDAVQNWWGDPDGPDGDCTGNVDCGDPLSTWPAGSSLAPPSTPATATSTATDEPSTGATTEAPTATGADGTGDATAADAGSTAGGPDADGAGTDDPTETAASTPSTPATTAGDGPLPPVFAVIGLVLGGFLAGRRVRSRR